MKKAQPDRLLIESIGLGHPKEVLQILISDIYREVILLQQIITLVDPRKLSDTRYTQHKIFNQQIAIADIIIGNKLDLYQVEDKTQRQAYVKQNGATRVSVILTQYGEMTTSTLTGKPPLLQKTITIATTMLLK